MRIVYTAVLLVLVVSVSASAQVLSRAQLRKAAPQGVATAGSTDGTDFVSQATLEFNSSEAAKPTVAVEALEAMFLNKRLAVHVRTTLPTSSSTPPDGQSVYLKPNVNLRNQLLDAFGGVANLSFGTEGKFETKNKDTRGSGDVRGAFKLVEVPAAATTSSVQDAYAFSGAFCVGVNGRLALYGVDSATNPVTILLSGSAFVSTLLDSTLTNRFSVPLQRTSKGVNAALVLSATHVYVSLGVKWSDDPTVGHQYLISFSPTK